MQSLYRGSVCYVRTNNIETQTYLLVTRGLNRAQCCSVPLATLMNDIIKECTTIRAGKLSTEYRNLNVIQISECALADDAAILASTQNML